jgi:hypothetical protein
MSWEYYIVPSLFWFGLAVASVGLIVGVAMVVRAVRDLINLECKDD